MLYYEAHSRNKQNTSILPINEERSPFPAFIFHFTYNHRNKVLAGKPIFPQ